jgi:predicted nucleotidyltransferase
MSLKSRVEQKREAVLEIATRFGASDVRLFGSTARGEDAADSDIDLLVRLERGRSLLDVIGLEQELSALLGAKVDVQLEGGLSPYLEAAILREAVAI